MNFDELPRDGRATIGWRWGEFAPWYDALTARAVDARWLADWSALSELVGETSARLYVAHTCDTTDEVAEAAYHAFLAEVIEPAQAADHRLTRLLLDSGLEPDDFAVPLRRMRTDVALFREVNLPLFTAESKLGSNYDRLSGAQTVEWDGAEVTLNQLAPVFEETDRERREAAWRLAAERQLHDREAVAANWREALELRQQQAANADYDDYRSFRWQQFHRYDYTPDDCRAFHAAIREMVLPAAARVRDRRRARMGLDTLRPWDLAVDPQGRPPLRPFDDVTQLIDGAARIFATLDPALGAHFATLRDAGLLDLENRKGKAPGGYCIDFDAVRQPFIFMNAVGVHGDVETLLHESGHCFHTFEAAQLPLNDQRAVGMEFAEVASMAMELLAAPLLGETFYTPAEAARARLEHLERIVLFWPYMVVVDEFQHRVYEHPTEAVDPDWCDAVWEALAREFSVGVDWSGLEAYRRNGWQQKLHIHNLPFYYVEYGFAQLGAVQVWVNSLDDRVGALARYRQALALGGTRPLPALYEAAGACFGGDVATLSEAVSRVEKEIEALETVK